MRHIWIALLLTGQQAAFQDFFRTFKSQGTTEAADALENLNLDADTASDDYDFMDDADENDGAQRSRRNGQARGPKIKYMTLLQDIADRKKQHITVDLDDVDLVRARTRNNIIAS